MGKVAFIFPGQGSQYVGMAKDFYDTNVVCRQVFDQANEVLDFDLLDTCFVENTNINETQYTQVAMLTACVAILRAVEEKNIKPDITAGLSLGEYAALVANKALEFEDAVRLVRKRGIYMSFEVKSGMGTMAAVLGLDNATVEEVCNQVENETKQCVQPANYNCPSQIVISGDKEAVLLACDRLKAAGARRTVELNVSGPFHSKLLKGAGDKLGQELKHVQFHEMEVPYVCNTEARIVEDSSEIAHLLEKQVYSSIRWQQSMEDMIAQGVTTFIEIGPGKTLSGFLKKIDKTVKVINIEKVEDLKKLEELTC